MLAKGAGRWCGTSDALARTSIGTMVSAATLEEGAHRGGRLNTRFCWVSIGPSRSDIRPLRLLLLRPACILLLRAGSFCSKGPASLVMDHTRPGPPEEVEGTQRSIVK